MRINRETLERVYSVSGGDAAVMCAVLQLLESACNTTEDEAVVRSLRALDPEEFDSPNAIGELLSPMDLLEEVEHLQMCPQQLARVLDDVCTADVYTARLLLSANRLYLHR